MLKIMLLMLFPVFFVGCFQNARHNAEDKFPGIYTRMVADPTGTLWDTLCISSVKDPSTHLFTIMKNSGIVNMGDHGEALPITYRHVQWTGEFIYNKHALHILENGDHYFLLPGEDAITNGFLTYTRIR